MYSLYRRRVCANSLESEATNLERNHSEIQSGNLEVCDLAKQNSFSKWYLLFREQSVQRAQRK